MTFPRKVWVWLKENYKAVLLSIFTLGIGLLVGKMLRKPQKVVNPELVEADKVKRGAQEQEDKKRLEAAKERAEKLVEIEKEHAKTIKELTNKQREKVEELKDDPDELNKYLLNVGRHIRG